MRQGRKEEGSRKGRREERKGEKKEKKERKEMQHGMILETISSKPLRLLRRDKCREAKRGWGSRQKPAVVTSGQWST